MTTQQLAQYIGQQGGYGVQVNKAMMYFTVKVVDARMSYGRAQLKIVIVGGSTHGDAWVDKENISGLVEGTN